jgi:hypothetical protein
MSATAILKCQAACQNLPENGRGKAPKSQGIKKPVLVSTGF